MYPNNENLKMDSNRGEIRRVRSTGLLGDSSPSEAGRGFSEGLIFGISLGI